MSHFKDLSTTPTLVAEILPKTPITPTTIGENPVSIDWSVTKCVPPEHKFRTLVLCFDGTGDEFDEDNSNVVQLVNLLKKDDPSKQVVYYQTGIGTYTSPKYSTPIITRLSKIFDVALAWNLKEHVMHGYEFLMQNYKAGDHICIFGFSRGAHTARALAGMLHKVGLLPPWNLQQLPFAYRIYKDNETWNRSNAFKTTFCTPVTVQFVGVWDTVESVGGLLARELPFASSNVAIRYFRHAVALDERRAKFKANLWHYLTEEEEKKGTDAKESAAAGRVIRAKVEEKKKESETKPEKKKDRLSWSFDPTTVLQHQFSKLIDGGHEQLVHYESQFNVPFTSKDKMPTNVEEVWFAGCHCDVGGGSVKNEERHSLARIPLRWMIRECFKTNSGIMFDPEKLLEVGLDAARLYPIVQPKGGVLPSNGLTLQRRERWWPPFRKAKSSSGEVHAAETSTHHEGSHEEKVVKKERGRLTEEEEDLYDALSPRYDQLSMAKWWWILELLPLKKRYRDANGHTVTALKWNLGRPREIPDQLEGVKIHKSVLIRKEAQGGKGSQYKPRPALPKDPNDIKWVD